MVNFYSQQNRNGSGGNVIPATSAKKSGKSKVNIEKYVDPTGEFGSKQYKWSFWYVKNKLTLYRLAVAGLAVFSAATVGFSLWKGFEILIYELTDKPVMESQLARATNYGALNASYAPAAINVLSTQVFTGGTDKIDAVAEVANTNARHVARFDYYFVFNGVSTEKQSGLLLPGDTHPIAILGLDATQFSSQAELMIENVRFTRVNNHTVPDVASWLADRLNFIVDNFVYTQAGSEQSANAIQFSLTNNSPYGYRHPYFYLGLYNNGGLVGVMKIDITDFQSLETRQMDLRNFVDNLSVTEIKLFPNIDVFDDSVYLAPKG